MEPSKATTSETAPKGEELRALVSKASEVIAHYWPMRGFVHHNPLHNLEHMHFQDAVSLAQRFTGGKGYLSNETYRGFVESERILPKHVDDALEPLIKQEHIDLNGSQISHADMLKAHLLSGAPPVPTDSIEAKVDRSEDRDTIKSLSEQIIDGIDLGNQETTALGREETLADWCDRELHTRVSFWIDREVIKWCEAFLDEGHAPWAMPERDQTFYQAWKNLAGKEWSPCGINKSKKKIAALPASPEEALRENLNALGIPEDQWQNYLSLELASLYGWASFINWRGENPDYEWQEAYPIDLVQYLAVRLWYEKELVQKACKTKLSIEGKFDAISSYLREQAEELDTELQVKKVGLTQALQLTDLSRALDLDPKALLKAGPQELGKLQEWLEAFPVSEHGPIWLKAFEAGYHEQVMSEVAQGISASKEKDGSPERPIAQSVFCIDVRSEPFRRNLEAQGNYETIGWAGFLNIFIRFRPHGAHHHTEQYPAIAKPTHTFHEVERDGQNDEVAKHKAGKKFFHTAHEILHDLKAHVLTPYITVESIGWIFGWPLIGRTMFPRSFRRFKERFSRSVSPPIETSLTLDRKDNGHDHDIDLGMTLDEQAGMLKNVLGAIGLTEGFARLILICGHGSKSDNNPYESALDCGACGGNPSKPNARAFATIANRPEVRAILADNGLTIPEDTIFIAGLHNTTTDEVEIYDRVDLPDSHSGDLAKLEEDLLRATIATNRERCLRLPEATTDPSDDAAVREIGRRAGDWSEVRPEWGLSGNASIVVGPRELTSHIDLEGRTFLVSHDYRKDPTEASLEGILAAPVVVGQWINCEHYFSATDPEVYGSGSKIYHNVVGRMGIMSGPQGDLRTGLARQSVMNGDQPYHEPLRALVVVDAPRERISRILKKHINVSQLFDNEWAHLVAVDRESEEVFYKYIPKKGWESMAIGKMQSSG